MGSQRTLTDGSRLGPKDCAFYLAAFSVNQLAGSQILVRAQTEEIRGPLPSWPQLTDLKTASRRAESKANMFNCLLPLAPSFKRKGLLWGNTF